MKILRTPQVTASALAMRSLDATGRALVVMATGVGKTILAVDLMERRRVRGRSLFTVHREEIIEQTAATLERETLLSVGIEHADRRVGAVLPDVVVASTQTLAVEKRRARFPRDAFATVFADEAHHYSPAAPTFASVLDHFTGGRVGLTATPERADGQPLMFGPITYRYTIRQAIRDGFLVDIRRVVEILRDLDLSRVRKHKGDWSDAELEAELIKAPAVAAVADAILRRAGARPTVAFCAGIAHSKAIAAALNVRRPGCAAYASGEERGGVEALTSGRVQILCNADLTTEGFDFPPLACVALVRPTKSGGRATQQIGRVTRKHDESGKRDGLVIEFVGLRASEQVRTVDVVGVGLSEHVRAEAERLLDRQPTLSVLDALDRAGASGGGAIERAPARPQRTVFDPMAFILSLDGMVLEQPRPGARPATPEQVVTLEREGLRAVGLDIRQAAILMEGIRWRRQRGRCSPMQAVALFAFGMDKEMRADVAARELAKLRAA